MKKSFKIVGIIVIVIVVLVGGISIISKIGNLQNENKKKQLNEERINAKTLTDYIKTRSCEYVDNDNGELVDYNCDNNLNFIVQDFKCDILNKDIKVLADTYFITKDNEIYDISFNQLYSNNQNCTKKELSFETKDIIVSNNNVGGLYSNIATKDNKVYVLGEYMNLKEEENPDNKSIIINNLNKNVKAIIHPLMYFNYNSNDGKTYLGALVLKSDNKLYKQHYIEEYVGNDSVVKMVKEEMVKSLEEYGNIKNIFLDNYTTSITDDFNITDDSITTIISDKGYYYLDEIKTDECTKYADIKCKKELKASEIYNRFSNDIKVLGQYHTILNDNSVIETNILKQPLDKNLKN